MKIGANIGNIFMNLMGFENMGYLRIFGNRTDNASICAGWQWFSTVFEVFANVCNPPGVKIQATIGNIFMNPMHLVQTLLCRRQVCK